MSLTTLLPRIIVIPLLLVLLNGCNTNTVDTSNLSKQPLMVDLSSVARALGRDQEINKKLEEARTSLNSQLKEIGSSLETQLQEKKSEIEASSKNKKEDEIQKSEQELQNLTVQAQIKLKQTQQLAEQKAVNFRTQLLNEFRQEVAAVAQEIAEKRGAVTVLAVNTDYLWYSASIDITDEVIGVLRSRPAKQEDKPATDTETETKQ